MREFDIGWYYDEIMIPTIKDFHKHPTSIRHALIACIVARHQLDYLERERVGSLMHFDRCFEAGVAKYMIKKYRQIQVLDAVANAAKHKYRDRDKKLPHFYVGWTFERPPAIAGLVQAGASMMGDMWGGVEVEYDGKTFDLRRVLSDFVIALQQEFSYFSGRETDNSPSVP